MARFPSSTSMDLQVSFSHVHVYVDHLLSLEKYKEIENFLNVFHGQTSSMLETSDTGLRSTWENNSNNKPSAQSFVPQNRDIIQQLIVGFGFRITGYRVPERGDDSRMNTKSYLVTSRDKGGVQFVVSAAADVENNAQNDTYVHFDVENLRRFYDSHRGRQGIAVLGFEANNVEKILERYQTLHPCLIHSFCVYKSRNRGSTKVLEVYAYYRKERGALQEDCSPARREPDGGTLLRFVEVERRSKADGSCILPGIEDIDAVFDSGSQPAYCDHWVSNVFSRCDFIRTLEDTLGFIPKVDFNAGVVAAGEAQIESTVTGNNSKFETWDKAAALKDQSQVFLPINNALSKVGHVHGFLEELGQGIQHIASRVENLVEFVERCNYMREMTGEGFTFLKIPRSYYGILTSDYLAVTAGISEDLAIKLLQLCERKRIISVDGAVDLDLEKDDIDQFLESSAVNWEAAHQRVYEEKKEAILAAVASSRYRNLYNLLHQHVSESTYMGIVRNKILVDIQGDDILYQIFTCNILQRDSEDEAPFLEFIQRVCSECKDETGCPVKIQPGCGGFGIRNFLTLFLSIEVSKALRHIAEARLQGDPKGAALAQRRVDCFTNQLNDSNPILTQISDAMNDEGNCKMQMEAAMEAGDAEATAAWKANMDKAQRLKMEGNARLMACSAYYEATMRSIRESGE